MTFTNVEHKITWEYLEAYLRYTDFASNRILSILQLLIFLKNQHLQTTVNMCNTDDSNMTFTTVEQKIAWEYLEAYLRYTDFA